MPTSVPIPSPATHHVVVLGAGYAGVVAANRILAGRSRSERGRVGVTVVNPRSDFVERIRLHEVIAGTSDTVARPLAEVLHRDARVVTGTAALIDPDRHTVTIDRGGTLSDLHWDTLVYAVGSTSESPVPGVAAHALLPGEPEGAARARAAVAALAGGSRVVVVGNGLTGIELSTEVAERRPDLRVTLAGGGPILPGYADRGRRHVRAALARLHVECHEDARVSAVSAGRAELATGGAIPFDACLWVAGFGVPDLARRSGLATDGLGRLRVDETLASIDAPDVIGAGDAIALPDHIGAHLRMSCAAALPLGGFAADTALARLRGDEPRPASVGFFGQCLSLGRHDGLLQFVHRDDRARGATVQGPAGAWVKERICRFTIATMKNERRWRNPMVALPGPSHSPAPTPDHPVSGDAR